MSPLVSVIVPVYNAVSYLSGTFNSIIAQTFVDFEVLLIDDGSTDGSGQICDDFAKIDSRIRVFHISNSGVSAARNYGIEHASGIYIWFVDSDDLVAPQMLQILVNDIESNKADLAMCSFLTIEEKTQIFSPVINQDTILIDNANHSHVLDLCFGKFVGSSYCIWDKLFTRKILISNDIRFNKELDRGEDGLFNIINFLHCERITYNSSQLYGYRSRPGSLIYSPDPHKFQKHLQFYNEVERLTDEYLSSRDANAFKNLFKNSMMYSVLDFNAPISVLRSNIKACKKNRFIFKDFRPKTRLMKLVFYIPTPICAYLLRLYSLCNRNVQNHNS